MSLDTTDFNLLKSLRNAVREGDEVNANLLRQLIRKNEEGQAKTADAFNRVADALAALTAEVKGLRADLNPQMDKAKLPAPKKGSDLEMEGG